MNLDLSHLIIVMFDPISFFCTYRSWKKPCRSRTSASLGISSLACCRVATSAPILRKWIRTTCGHLVAVSESRATWCQSQMLGRSQGLFHLLLQEGIFHVQRFNPRCSLKRSHITNFRKQLKPTWSGQSHPETSVVSLTRLQNDINWIIFIITLTNERKWNHRNFFLSPVSKCFYIHTHFLCLAVLSLFSRLLR